MTTAQNRATKIQTVADACGAVREACEFILSARGEWSAAESGLA